MDNKCIKGDGLSGCLGTPVGMDSCECSQYRPSWYSTTQVFKSDGKNWRSLNDDILYLVENSALDKLSEVVEFLEGTWERSLVFEAIDFLLEVDKLEIRVSKDGAILLNRRR